MLKNLLRRTPPDSPEGAQASIKAAHTRLDTARADLADAKAAHGRALLAADEGEDNAGAEVKRSRADLDRAHQHVEDAEAALSAAEARFREVQAHLQDNETADRWRRVEALAAERMKVAGEVEQMIQELADKVAVLLQLGTDLHSLAPVKPAGLVDSLCGPNYTVRYLRDELARAGAPWSRESIGIALADLRPLSEGIAEGNGEVLKMKSTTER